MDARIVNHKCKRVVTLEMSCPWVNNRKRKDEKKALKYRPLRWELKQQLPDYEMKQYNIIIDALGGWSRDLDVRGRSTDVLRKIQRAVFSGTLNIERERGPYTQHSFLGLFNIYYRYIYREISHFAF